MIRRNFFATLLAPFVERFLSKLKPKPQSVAEVFLRPSPVFYQLTEDGFVDLPGPKFIEIYWSGLDEEED